MGGGGKGGGGKSGGQTGGSAGKNHCYCCGSGEHWSNSCDQEVWWAEGRDPQEVFLDKDLSLGEVALDFRLGEPRGVFPVQDSGKGEKRGGKQLSESTSVSPESLGLGNLKTQREEDLRKGGKEDMQYYDQGMGNRGEVFMSWEGFEPGTWSLELWDLK